MTEHRALTNLFDKADSDYFRYNHHRKAHIRKAFAGENEAEFQTLGYHEKNRRRILLTRVDYERNFLPKQKVLKIPFLAFADEEIADRDDVLLPIIEEIMYGEMRKMR